MSDDEALLRPPLPFCTNVELTSLCNQRCVMCPLTARNTLSSRDPGPMPHAVWERVLPVLGLIGQVQWIGYGETLLHPRALEYMQEADAAGIRSSLATNGTRLSEQACEALGRLRHLVHVTVSVDSPDPAIYRSVRKTPLAPVLRGLETILRHVEPRSVTVGSVMMRDNVESLADMPALLARYGVAKYQINVLHEHKGRHFAGELTTDSAAAVRRLRAACDSHGIQLIVDVPGRLAANLDAEQTFAATFKGQPAGARTRRCLLPWEFPFIDKDGRLFLCSNATGREDELLGSLQEQPFLEIWHGEKMQAIRRAFLEGTELPVSCRNCTIQDMGVHQLVEHRAGILSGSLLAPASGEAQLSLEVRNLGRASWGVGEVSIGTVRPRDRFSAYYTPRWLSGNRVVSNEAEVRPGEVYTFAVPISDAIAGQDERFQLVADGRYWIPATEFAIARAEARPEPAPRAPSARFDPVLWWRRLRRSRSGSAA